MRIRKAPTPESEHRELYRLLGVDEKIMSPKTIWTKQATTNSDEKIGKSLIYRKCDPQTFEVGLGCRLPC